MYLDTAVAGTARPAAATSPVFVSTSSLTKSYGLAGLRCGWVLAHPDVAESVARARDIVDGTGAFPAERLSVLAFSLLDRLAARARRLLEANGRTMRAFLESQPELEYVWPSAGTVVFPRIRGVDDAGPFVERLAREFETDVVPGRFFQAPAHFRVGFGGRPEVLADGLSQLGRALAGPERPTSRSSSIRDRFLRDSASGPNQSPPPFRPIHHGIRPSRVGRPPLCRSRRRPASPPSVAAQAAGCRAPRRPPRSWRSRIR